MGRERIRITPLPETDAPATPKRPRQRIRLNTPRVSTGPSILDAIADPDLFAPFFKDHETWAVWFAILAAIFCIPMTPEQLKLYQQVSGRQEPPTLVAKEVWLVLGRRGGKSRILSLIAVWLACFFEHSEFLSPGERGTIQVIAPDRDQAKLIIGYVKKFIAMVPLLAPMIESETRESISLSNDVTITVATASFKSVRGFTLLAVLADEIAFWESEDSANPDVEVLAAVKPGMLTVPHSMLLCASSPYARRGALYAAYEKHYGKEGDPVLVFQADTKTVNPVADDAEIAEAYEKDAVRASAEYGAQFRNDSEVYVSLDVVMACVSKGFHERPREAGISYFAFIDPAGGSGSDSFTLAIGHKDKTSDMSVVDCIREFKPPFSPEAVVNELSQVLKSYGVTRILGDKFAGLWVREPFKKHGITYDPSAAPKSDLYRDALPLLNSKKVDLLDHPKMITQFVGLERRVARSGKESIDHQKKASAHDDIANVCAGLLVNIGVKKFAYDSTLDWVSGPNDDDAWRRMRLQHYMTGGRYL